MEATATKGIRVLLVIAGLLAVGVGFAMLFATQAFLAPQGIVADDKVATVGQAMGSLMLGIGTMNLLGVRCSDLRGLQAICGSNVVIHAAALGVNIHALSAHLVSKSVMGDAAGHVVFGLAFAASLVVLARRHPARS